MITQALDPKSPVPLFHQLAEIIRYRIATGTLPAGSVLPPLRRAAEEWGINLHTVRHAYSELDKQGLTQTLPPKGTVVLGARHERDEKTAFLARVIRDASERFGMSIDELQQSLGFLGRGRSAQKRERVLVVECSEIQSSDLARQLDALWDVDAEPWSLERPGEPPAGTIVATYFHYNDVRGRWPTRFPSVRFLTSHPAAEIAGRLKSFVRGRGRVEAVLCERDATTAQIIAADLRRVLPSSILLRQTVSASPGEALQRTRIIRPMLFAPRIWATLTPAQRADPRAIQLRYVFDSAELAAVGRDLGWMRNGQVVDQRALA